MLGLLGHPVAQSRSPAFQNAALQALAIPLRYEAWDVTPAALATWIVALRAARGAGNVTIPHKGALYALCDVVTPLASRVGAVNTFWTDPTGRLHGDNTDVAGFDAAVDGLGIDRPRAVVALLGAGGSAAAVCAAVERWPEAHVVVHARRRDAAERLRERFAATVHLADTAEGAVARATLVVNATPVGMRDDECPIAVASLARDAGVMDLVYRPGETRWVREARASGHRACDGREMLLHQGAAAFTRWFGRTPPIHVMRSALDESLVVSTRDVPGVG